jgi:hypothetical protein
MLGSGCMTTAPKPANTRHHVLDSQTGGAAETHTTHPRETKTIANAHEDKDADRIQEKCRQSKRTETDLHSNARSSSEQLRRPLPTEYSVHSNAATAVSDATKYITDTFPRLSLVVRAGDHPEDLAYTIAADRMVGRRPKSHDNRKGDVDQDTLKRMEHVVAGDGDTENSSAEMLWKYLDAFAARLCAAMICGRMSFVVERHPIDPASCRLGSPGGHESITTTWRREFFDVITNRWFSVRSWYERWKDESETSHVEIVTAADMPKQQQQKQPETTA